MPKSYWDRCVSVVVCFLTFFQLIWSIVFIVSGSVSDYANAASIATIVSGVLGMILAILLFVGVITRDWKYVFVYLVIQVPSSVVMGLTRLVMMVNSEQILEAGILLGIIVMHLTLYYCVYLFYKRLRNNQKRVVFGRTNPEEIPIKTDREK